MKKILAIVGGIVGFVVMLMVAGTGSIISRHIVQENFHESIEVRQAAIAKHLSKQLPQKVDEITTWQSVASEGPLLIYNYTIDSTKIEIDWAVMLSRMKSNLKTLACTPESTVEDGGRYKYSYVGEDGTAIGSVEVGKRECE